MKATDEIFNALTRHLTTNDNYLFAVLQIFNYNRVKLFKIGYIKPLAKFLDNILKQMHRVSASVIFRNYFRLVELCRIDLAYEQLKGMVKESSPKRIFASLVCSGQTFYKAQNYRLMIYYAA